MLEIIKDEELIKLSNAIIICKTATQYFEKYGSLALNYNGPSNSEHKEVCQLLSKYCDKVLSSISETKDLFLTQENATEA